MTDPALIQLSPCTIIRASGPDALRFLNGQLTNDVALASSEVAIHAAALNAKGGLEAICWVRKSGDDFLLDAPLSLREALMARLDRYLIADDVELTDESDDWTIIHLLNTPSAPNTGILETSNPSRFGALGFDLLTKNPADLDLPDLKSLTDDQVLDLRIANGIPAWDTELTPGMLPPEAGLQTTAISYEKGCYLGQEVISRMKWAGKTNRHLVRLKVPSDTKAETEFFAEESVAGTICSVSTFSQESTSLALGYRKRKFEDRDSFELADKKEGVLIQERLS